MRLILTRHGKTLQNESGIIMGRTPGELSELGHIQAQMLGKRLNTENIDMIYSSPSARCRDTLNDILPRLEKTPTIEFVDDLLERDFGELTGKQLTSDLFTLLENNSSESQRLGIESIEHLFQRTKDFIETIKEKHVAETVLILTHSNNIRAMLMYFLSKSFVEVLDITKVKNCAFTEFEFTNQKGFELQVVDDTSHLK